MVHDFLFWAGGVIVSAIFSLMGWTMKMLHNKIDKNTGNYEDLQRRFEAHRLHAAEIYATKKDMDKGFDRVMNKLDDIDAKLDRKVDK